MTAKQDKQKDAKPAGPAKAAAEVDPLALLEAVLARARAAESSGDAAKALALIDAAPEPAKAIGTYHFARGSLLFRKGDLPAATAALRRAIEIEPEIPEFKANLGAALVETARRARDEGVLAEAIDLLSTAAAAGPRTALVHNNLGMALQSAGRAAEALDAYDSALAIDAGDVSALYNRAAALHLLGREEECLEALDATLAVAPGFEPAKTSRANTLKRLGR